MSVKLCSFRSIIVSQHAMQIEVTVYAHLLALSNLLLQK